MKLQVEHLIIAAFVLTAVGHSWNFWQPPFWVYAFIGVGYFICEITGINDKEI